MLYALKYFQQSGIVFRHHDTEPDEFSVQALEGRAVPDHKTVFDACFKHIKSGDFFFLYFQQQEIGIWPIGLVSAALRERVIHPSSLRQDETPRFFDIFFILKEQLTGIGSNAV